MKYIGYGIIIVALIMTFFEVGWKIILLPFAIVMILLWVWSGAKM